MGRTVSDAKIETRAARLRLAVGGRPVHWKTLIPGQKHLGYRRKSKDVAGSWLVRIYVGGERYRVAPLGTADDLAEADSKAAILSYADAQKLALAYRPQAGARQRRAGGLTVQDAIGDYVDWLRVHKSPNAARDARQRADLHILPKLGATAVVSLTTDQLNRWRDKLAQQPAQMRPGKGGKKRNLRAAPTTPDELRARRHTANKIVTTLKAALNFAHRSDLVADATAWSGARFKSFAAVNAARPDFLTNDEARRFLNAADPKSGFRDLAHAALLTGCRYGELCALNVRDFANGKIAIVRSKSGKARDVRLTDEGKTFFEQLCAGRAPEAPMLLNLGRLSRTKERGIDDDGRWRKGEQGRPMAAACEAARLTPIGFHQLRHTWASLSVMAEMPLIVVASNLGHADTRMVERHYGHLEQNYLDEAIRNAAPRFGLVEKGNVSAIRKKANRKKIDAA